MTSEVQAAAEGGFTDLDREAAFLEHGVAELGGDSSLTSITALAAKLCDTPIALVSLVEERRQWFPARAGLAADETPRETSFCAHAMVGSDIMVVADASSDPQFRDNPLVTGDPGIRFYAGAPLVTEEGVPLGALCVIDRSPREDLSDLQREGLAVLAANVMQILAARRSRLRAASDSDE